jgi:hypothetical protein
MVITGRPSCSGSTRCPSPPLCDSRPGALQDLIVPPDEWRRALKNCVAASNAKKRGLEVD